MPRREDPEYALARMSSEGTSGPHRSPRGQFEPEPVAARTSSRGIRLRQAPQRLVLAHRCAQDLILGGKSHPSSRDVHRGSQMPPAPHPDPRSCLSRARTSRLPQSYLRFFARTQVDKHARRVPRLPRQQLSIASPASVTGYRDSYRSNTRGHARSQGRQRTHARTPARGPTTCHSQTQHAKG